MESPPTFGFRDVMKAPAAAISAKQILVMTLFVLMALSVYDLFLYLAHLINGDNIKAIYQLYGLLPLTFPQLSSMGAKVILCLGTALSVFAVMLGFLAVSILNIESVRGNRFMRPMEAIRFAFRRAPQVFLAELSIVLFLALLVGLFALLGLICRIPVVGEWIYTLLFAIPNFVVSIFAVFVIFVLCLTVLLMPSVAAADRKGETFNAIVETFSTMILQPLRWAGYTIYSLVSAKLAGFVYAYFTFRAVQFLVWSTSLGGGSKLKRLVESGLAHLPVRSDLFREVFNLLPGISFGVRIWTYAGTPTRDPISTFMALMLFVVFAGIIGYMLAAIAAGQARGYVALKHRKDGYDIASEKPQFWVDEPVNDPVEPSPENA